MWLRWLLEGRLSKADLAHLLQCDEEIDEDSISISSKRPAFSPYLEHRPAKRMKATTLPAIKVPSSFLSFAHHHVIHNAVLKVLVPWHSSGVQSSVCCLWLKASKNAVALT